MAATNASLNNNNNNKKRVATDVLDLTHTTTGAESDSDDAVVVPQTKRSRTSITTTTTATATAVAAAAAEAKRKSKQRADKEKLVAESAQWRAKYKKAFPSFTFYFDALDATTEQSLVKSVQSLGAVSLCLTNASRSRDTNNKLDASDDLTQALLITVRRQLLFEEGHARRHLATRPCGRWQGELSIGPGRVEEWTD